VIWSVVVPRMLWIKDGINKNCCMQMPIQLLNMSVTTTADSRLNCETSYSV